MIVTGVIFYIQRHHEPSTNQIENYIYYTDTHKNILMLYTIHVAQGKRIKTLNHFAPLSSEFIVLNFPMAKLN
jgi:hypothetical protein